jgi:[acyl-carrier-protein] S-malonyltransferase
MAFLYPGQGSQKIGMGATLATSDSATYRRYMGLAEEVSGLPLRRLSCEGPIEQLTRTEVVQPALFALSLAVTEIAHDAGLQPDFVAGHSLGEYTAAVAAGALSVEDGTRLVSERGRLMASIQDERPGTMAAIMGLSVDELERLCRVAAEGRIVAPANINAPDQIVVSGEEPAVARLLALAEDAGAMKLTRIKVGAAFHTELMRPVRERLEDLMREVRWRDARIPLVANASGRRVTASDDIRAALLAQIVAPVRWSDCVRTLYAAGVREGLELGPGRTLARLVRAVHRDVYVSPADSRAAVQEASDRLAGVGTP